jgi:hypothetical protein
MVAALSAFGTGSALAASEFGDTCAADDGFGSEPAPLVAYEVSHPENPLPTVAPISGVITRWGINVKSESADSFPVVMKVLRFNPGAPPTVSTVAEAVGDAHAGSNSFPARIPVQAGDRVGNTVGAFGPIVCQTATSGTVGLTGATAVGAAPAEYGEGEEELRVPIFAAIEADVDGDGYGDETQDGCPQSALYHEACPVIVLGTIVLAGKSAATVRVATSLEATVSVQGTVKLGKRGKVTIKAKAKTVAAGRYGVFKLKFPAKLRKKLKKLPRSKKLPLKVTASAPNIATKASTARSSLKLKGQAR